MDTRILSRGGEYGIELQHKLIHIAKVEKSTTLRPDKKQRQRSLHWE